MTVQDFIKHIESGKAKVLTLEAAKNLIGKTIVWFYYSDPANYGSVEETTIGRVINEVDYYVNVMGVDDAHPNYPNHYEFLKAKVPHLAKEAEQNTIILDENNQPTYIVCYGGYSFFDEPTFTCSDADREVYYIEKDSL